MNSLTHFFGQQLDLFDLIFEPLLVTDVAIGK